MFELHVKVVVVTNTVGDTVEFEVRVLGLSDHFGPTFGKTVTDALFEMYTQISSDLQSVNVHLHVQESNDD